MPRRMVCGRWPWWSLAVLGTLACQVGKDELTVTTVELTSGDFQSLAWGGAQVERFHVVARLGESDEAVIWSPDHRAPCSLGTVAWYSTTQPLRLGGLAVGALGRGLVPFVDTLDDAGRGTLRFAGIDCRPLAFELPDVKRSELWTIEDTALAKPIYVAKTSDRRLIFADPWLGSQREVAHDVSGIAPLTGKLWIVESGQAVLRDLKGVELARTGQGVRELVVLNGEGDIAYVDANGLSVWRSTGDTVSHIANDACAPRVLDGFPQGTLAYFSPCDQQQLVIKQDKHAARVVARAIVAFTTANGWLCYTVKTDTSTELWITSTEGKATRLVTTAGLDLDRVWARARNKLLVSMAQPDGALSLWDIDTAHKSAVQIERDLASVRVASASLLTIDANRTLHLERMGDLKVELVAKDVAASNVRFLFDESLPALGYLANADHDTGLGRFELHFLSNGAQDPPPIANVREIHEVWWPESGIVYATGKGKGEGLWFARVDVPCDKTSDTPWACGF